MSVSSSSLLDEALEAHGGLKPWNELKSADAHCLVNGGVWPLKGVAGVLSDFHYEFDLHQQTGRFPKFTQADRRATFQADRVDVETDEGATIEELLCPGASLEGQTLESTWSRLQLIYFVGYAIWSYITTPFCFTMPGFVTEEIKPWQHDDETWRCLKVTFPDYLARHAKEQVYFFGPDGLLRRHDYVSEPVTKERTATHYMADNKQFSGITIATRQRVYVLNPDGLYSPETLLVALDIEELSLRA